MIQIIKQCLEAELDANFEAGKEGFVIGNSLADTVEAVASVEAYGIIGEAGDDAVVEVIVAEGFEIAKIHRLMLSNIGILGVALDAIGGGTK